MHTLIAENALGFLCSFAASFAAGLPVTGHSD